VDVKITFPNQGTWSCGRVV